MRSFTSASRIRRPAGVKEWLTIATNMAGRGTDILLAAIPSSCQAGTGEEGIAQQLRVAQGKIEALRRMARLPSSTTTA